MKQFQNNAKKISEEERKTQNPCGIISDGYYSYDQVSPLLYVWSRFFQHVVSLAATKMLTDVWHISHTSIYKSEGGCNLPGLDWLVLYSTRCGFDNVYGREYTPKELQQLNKCSQLISHIVLNWDPHNPTDSLVTEACNFIEEDDEKRLAVKEKLEEHLLKIVDNVFGGDALSSFFGYNPFLGFEDDNREYRRYCLIHHNPDPMTEEEVDQKYADEDLGKDLLKQMKEAAKKISVNNSKIYIMACSSPQRDDDGLRFWVNTGRKDNLTGWRTQGEIREFIKNPNSYKEDN